MAALTQIITRSTDGRSVQTAGAIALWRSEPGAALENQLTVPGYLAHAEFSPDGRKLLAVNDAGYPSYVFVWETATRKLVTKLKHPDSIEQASFSPNGRQIITAGVDRVARLWDLESGQLLRKFPQDQYVWRTYFSPDGRVVLTLTGDGKLQLWDGQTGFALSDLVKLASRIQTARFSADGNRFVVTPLDKAIRVFDTKTSTNALPPLVLEANATWADYSPDGKTIIGVGFHAKPRVWDAQSGELLRELPLSTSYHTAAFHPKAEVLATGSGNAPEQTGAVHLWKWREGRLALEPLVIPGQVTKVCFSPVGSEVAALSNTGRLRVWDAGTGRLLLERSNHSTYGAALAFRPDGRQLLVAYGDGSLDLLDLPSTLERAPEWLGVLAESVAGSRLNAEGGLESVELEKLASLRQSLRNSKDTDNASRWAKWFLADRQSRVITPGSDLSVDDYALNLTQRPGPLTNRFKALQLAPNNGLLYARLAFDLASSPARTNVVAQATNQWNGMVEWYVNQATNLAPGSAEVWALRAATLLAIGRKTEVSAAADRAVNLDAQNPNGWYAKALSLAATGAKNEAYAAFLKALDFLPRKTSDIEWQNQRLRPFLLGALQEWIELERLNPIEMARLGRGRLDDTDPTERKFWEAHWLTKRATELAPDDPEVWRLRAVTSLGADEEKEALAAIKRAVDVDEQGNPDPRQFGAFLRERSELLDKAGRSDESRAFVLKYGIPPRPANATSLQLDLSRYYNVALREDLHRSKGAANSSGTWFANLPSGLVKLAGVEFDVRGHVHLNGQRLAQGFQSSSGVYAVAYPDQVRGIPVNQKAQWLHFLHISTWDGGMKNGTIIGRYRVHYADGQTHDFPIALGRDVHDWWGLSASTTTHSQIAWRERSAGSYKTLFASTWENPHPDTPIRELDMISDMTLAAPSILAVTLENPKLDDVLAQMGPASLAEEAMAKLTLPQGLDAAGKAYADKLTRLALSKAPEEKSIRRARAEALVRIGRLSDAKTLIDALLGDDPNAAEAWHLKASLLANTGQTDDAIAAWRKSLELLPATDEASKKRRQIYIQTAVDVLSAEGRIGEARKFFVQANIPPRDPSATLSQVDLGAHYNAAFSEVWFQRPDIATLPPVLQTFPAGPVTFQGIVFDARGVVQLNDRARRFVHEFPNEVSGIRLGAKGNQIHFVHATSMDDRFGTVVIRYRMHYANGEVREFPISADRDIGNFYLNSNPEGNLIWKAEKVTDSFGDVGLFLSTWDNPLPDVEITSIDLVSALSEAQPFVVAITVERFKTDAEFAALPPKQLAELAFHKVNPKVRPGKPAVEYAHRLSQKALELGANDPEVRRWRAEMLHRLGEDEPALAEVQKSLELAPDSTEAWQLKVELLSKRKQFDALPAAQTELRRHELKQKIPPRDPNARPNLVDLSAHYTVALTEEPHARVGFPEGHNLSGLPRGLQRLGGIEFDMRGLVHVSGAYLEAVANRLSFPRAVNHIAVGQRGRKLHFLQGAGWGLYDPDGTVIGKYLVHFANGEQREVPIFFGADVYDWLLSEARRNQPSAAQSKLAWRGPAVDDDDDREVHLYLKTWENPLPDVEISHIDLISEMHEAAPFLVALTVE